MNIKECDATYTLTQLRVMAKEAGLSTSGSKKELCSRLIAESLLPEHRTEKERGHPIDRLLAEPQKCKVCGRTFPAGEMIYIHTERAYICKGCYWPEMRRRYPAREMKRTLTFKEEEIRDRFVATQKQIITDEIQSADYFRRMYEREKTWASEALTPEVKAQWEQAASSSKDAMKYFEEEAAKRQKAIEKAYDEETWQYIELGKPITYEMWYELTRSA